jgi:2-amino-4-hydroxy-6-hydroxymethyldihydropteridine diphosphokinase
MNSDKHIAYLLLGSNLGNREKLIDDALTLIADKVGEIVLKSSVYETAPWGKIDQPGFLNLALAVETIHCPEKLLEIVLAIEQSLGRTRHEKWGSRLIDIDIILYGDEVIDRGNMLQIPHPEMQNRKFVMLPLTEIAADFIHPVLNKRMIDILSALTDDLAVFKKLHS